MHPASIVRTPDPDTRTSPRDALFADIRVVGERRRAA